MAKNSYKKNKNNKNVKKKEKVFSNPASKVWGKIIIATLAILMCLGGLISLIFLIIQNAK